MFGKFGSKISDTVTKWVGTWTFVVLYSVSMLIWIILHLTGILNIDGPDFIKWNLWLSYFAGIQASIVLMSTERQARKDREKQEEALYGLGEQIDILGELVEDYIEDINERNK